MRTSTGRSQPTERHTGSLAWRIAHHWVRRPPRRGLLALLGPGLITGASDDDPSGIATYSQAGAQFGYSMTWVMLFTWPLMAAIQEISARIGRVTGHGIAGNIRRHVAIVAVLGTTITPYCFFWQSSQEAEEERVDPAAHALIDAPEEARYEIGRMRIDTYLGMGFSNLISLFIIITTAATLNAHGITDIQTSAQAAEALRPIAGVFTFALFAAGIIGIGALSVPVLAGSAAYALGEGLDWPTGLARRPLDAKAFYGAIGAATLIGVLINLVHLDPIKALFWSAVINGVVAVPLMVVIMVMAMQRQVMGAFTLPRLLWAMGWLATAAMTAAVTAMFLTL